MQHFAYTRRILHFLRKTDLLTHFDTEMQQTAASGEKSSHTQRDMFPKTLTLQLDFDKTLKTPKVSSQGSYSCAKLKTHHLGLYCASDDHFYCFLYDETVGTTGPNEVISLLDHLLLELENKLGKHDHLNESLGFRRFQNLDTRFGLATEESPDLVFCL